MRRNRNTCSAAFALVLLARGAAAEPEPPAWLDHPAGERLEQRLAPPPGAHRVALAPRSFGAWLRQLPLLPAGTKVHLFDGSEKPRQDVHAAVVDLDVGKRDLQQCADAVMRLRAEYLLAAGRARDIVFHPDAGRPRELRYTGAAGDRPAFMRYMTRVFADAGTASLAAELEPVGGRAIEPGDVLIQGGYPGHAVLVLDVAEGQGGVRYALIGQSYMPAQQFHVVVNPAGAPLSPWFDLALLDPPSPGLQTPEWRPMRRVDARRFSERPTVTAKAREPAAP